MKKIRRFSKAPLSNAPNKKVIKIIHDTGTQQQRRNGYTTIYTDDDGAVHARARYKSILALYKMRGFLTKEQEEAGNRLYSYWYYGPGTDHAPLTTRYDRIKVPQDVAMHVAERYTRCFAAYREMMELLSSEQQKIVRDVCIFERPLADYYPSWQCRKTGKAGKLLLCGLEILAKWRG